MLEPIPFAGYMEIDINNEPVAWLCEEDDDVITDAFLKSGRAGDCSEYTIPLYTHPAKTRTLVLDGNRVYPTAKTLTDEEINKLWTDSYDFNGRFCVYEFARAILKKASEK